MTSLFARLAAPAAMFALAATMALPAAAQNKFTADLSGFSEVPSIVSDAVGSFTATVASDNSSLTYTLSYSGFDSTVIQAHIHVAQPDVNGAVSVFLCGPAGSPAHQTCPQSGTVTGMLTAADVLNVPAQGVAAGELDRLLRAIRAGVSYANVHTANHPGGEIRGDITAKTNNQNQQ
jgi:hypothetical protein